MKLHIARWARTLNLGFALKYYIELTPEEASIIAQYHLTEHPLIYEAGKAWYRVKDLLKCSKDKPGEFYSDDVTKVLNEEAWVRERCNDLKLLIERVPRFQGEETIEF